MWNNILEGCEGVKNETNRICLAASSFLALILDKFGRCVGKTFAVSTWGGMREVVILTFGGLYYYATFAPIDIEGDRINFRKLLLMLED